MKKIIVASKNPVKIGAALEGFTIMFPEEAFEVEGVSAVSGVSDQPMSNAETLQGARQRVENAYAANQSADFWIGIEGGIEEVQNEMEAFAWIVVKSKDGSTGRARTGTFFLPPRVAELVRQGKELGEADDVVFGKTNSKQDNGAVGLLTDNAIHRKHYYTHATVLALIPLKKKDLYVQEFPVPPLS